LRTYILIHQNTGTIIADRLKKANGWWELGIGLIGVPRIKEGEGIILPKTRSIHTFGMLTSIDVLFLDASGQTVGWKSSLKPWKIAIGHNDALDTIELKPGTLSLIKSLKLGDQFLIHC
jgi:uncharacterized membrane protein (UPF0127 family)